MLALAANALTVLAIAVFDLGSVPLILAMAAAGLLQGMARRRDMLVRAVTPRGRLRPGVRVRHLPGSTSPAWRRR